MKLWKENEDLQDLTHATAHLIHGSSEGRFKITYAPPDTCRRRILNRSILITSIIIRRWRCILPTSYETDSTGCQAEKRYTLSARRRPACGRSKRNSIHNILLMDTHTLFKYQSLIDHLGQLESVVVAFSGGVDSSFLRKSAGKC